MAKYLLKRLGTSIITFVLVSFVVYFLIDATEIRRVRLSARTIQRSSIKRSWRNMD